MALRRTPFFTLVLACYTHLAHHAAHALDVHALILARKLVGHATDTVGGPLPKHLADLRFQRRIIARAGAIVKATARQVHQCTEQGDGILRRQVHHHRPFLRDGEIE